MPDRFLLVEDEGAPRAAQARFSVSSPNEGFGQSFQNSFHYSSADPLLKIACGKSGKTDNAQERPPKERRCAAPTKCHYATQDADHRNSVNQKSRSELIGISSYKSPKFAWKCAIAQTRI